ncbi:hypothetical protein [Acinetobacter venetianus]|uniref:hypothetical protein n=1 Tax=Acinetobacter venetianus TaxID=52133 RepID=UPI003A8F0C9F
MKVVRSTVAGFVMLACTASLQAKERLSFDEWQENKKLYQTQAIGAWDCEQLSNKTNQLVIEVEDNQATLFLSSKKVTYESGDISRERESFSGQKTKVVGYDLVDGKTVKKEMSFDYINFDYSLHILSYQLLVSREGKEFLNFKCVRR